MKKILLLILAISFFLSIPSVSAYEALSVNASESSNGEITVSGTVENSMVAAAVNVYDASGENLITMRTTQINDDNTFSTQISLDAGTYIIKVADYNGGEYKSLTVTPGSNTTATDIKTPATGDNILVYILIGILSITGLSCVVIYLKKVSD